MTIKKEKMIFEGILIKIIVTILLFSVVLSINPTKTFADLMSGDFNYIESNGKIIITRYIGTGVNVVIPQSINNKDVISIGASAFEGCNTITNISIPESVININAFAFKNCYYLIEIFIPNSVIEIGAGAFMNCERLVTVNLSANLSTISDGLFFNCKGLPAISIPNGITTIGIRAFKQCTNLVSIIIPDSVISIGNDEITDEGAFAYCSNLAEVTLSKNLSIISDGTFYYCESLTNITIPDNIVRIGNNAFGKCINLVKISLSNNISEIGEYSFNDCSSLTSLAIPNSISTIDILAFLGCSNLERIYFGNGLISVGLMAFMYCDNIKSVYFYGNAPELGDMALYKEEIKINVYKLNGKTGFTDPIWTDNYIINEFIPVAPTVPCFDNVIDKTGTSVTLMWTHLENDVVGYDIYKGGDKENIFTFSGNKITITGLTQGIEYSFSIRAVNNYGFSPNSTSINVRTDFLKGDATGNGIIDISDMTAIKLHILNSYVLLFDYKKACDINNDGKIAISDIMIIKKHLIGLQLIDN